MAKLIYAETGEPVITGLTVGFGAAYPELVARATGKVIEVLETHGDELCPKYGAEVLPDEAGNCSLCGAILEG